MAEWMHHRIDATRSAREEPGYRSRWAGLGYVGWLFLLAAVGLVGGRPTAAQSPESAPPPSFIGSQHAAPALVNALNRRGDLTLRGVPLESAILHINENWQVNIVAGQVSGTVNGAYKNAPLREILDTILLSNGYGYQLVGDSIVVSPLQSLGSINPYFVSTAVRIANVPPSTIIPAISALKTPKGEVRAVDNAASLILIDFPDRVQAMKDLALQIDASSAPSAGSLQGSNFPSELQTAYFHTQYISAEQAATAIDPVLSTLGQRQPLDKLDRLVVVDTAQNIAMAKRVLERIDQPRPQVQITALIYDLSLEDIEEIGINWNHNIKSTSHPIDPHADPARSTSPAQSLAANSLLVLPNAAANQGTFTFMSLNTNFDLTAVALALQNASDSRLLADPNITVIDNELASFEAVQKIPLQQLTSTSQGGQLATTAFQDAGIKLSVIPKIAADGTLELRVDPEFSRLVGFNEQGQPIIDTRNASTVVRVTDGQTLVIGGMRQRTDIGSFAGVPGMKDLRFFGHLFRARNTNIRESELVVFIRPRIIAPHQALSGRHQLVADTVDGRLDHIPRAEGLPAACCSEKGLSGNCGPCGNGKEGPSGPPVMYEEWESADCQSPLLADPATTAPALPPSNYSTDACDSPPINGPRWPGVEGATAQGTNAALQPRRLPPLESLRTAQVPEKPAWALRRDYDSRFRATGGLHAGDQRTQERKPEPPPATAEKQSPRVQSSLWDMLFRK